ncbi:MAG: hypothetical protein EU544_05305, partial [Promethearchaeota archaeon]
MIEDFLEEEKQAIDEELSLYFEELEKDTSDVLFNDFLDQMKEFIIPDKSKAKRIHPILLIAAFSGIINPLYLRDEILKVRKVAIAVELLHSGHLIHDDLIDDDDMRRGKAAFHVQLRRDINKVYKSMELPGKKELENLYGRDLSILG